MYVRLSINLPILCKSTHRWIHPSIHPSKNPIIISRSISLAACDDRLLSFFVRIFVKSIFRSSISLSLEDVVCYPSHSIDRVLRRKPYERGVFVVIILIPTHFPDGVAKTADSIMTKNHTHTPFERTHEKIKSTYLLTKRKLRVELVPESHPHSRDIYSFTGITLDQSLKGNSRYNE